MLQLQTTSIVPSYVHTRETKQGSTTTHFVWGILLRSHGYMYIFASCGIDGLTYKWSTFSVFELLYTGEGYKGEIISDIIYVHYFLYDE